MGYISTHLFSFALLVGAVMSAGAVAEKRWPSLGTGPFRPLTRFVTGSLVCISIVFFLAVVGLLRPSVIKVLVLAAVGCAVVATWRHPQELTPQLSSRRWTRLPNIAPVVALAVVLAALAIQALRPGPLWDAAVYHLTIPRLYLEHAGFRPITFSVYSNWPLNLEMLYAIGMGLHDFLTATLVHTGFAFLICWALIRMCAAYGQPNAGPVAACLFLANDIVLVEAGMAGVDVGLAFFFLMAFAYALEADRLLGSRRTALCLAGISSGLMAGVKMIGIFGIACIVWFPLWKAWREARFRQGLREVIFYLTIPCAIVALPWYVKAAWYTGNPVYPFWYDVLHGDDWNRALAERFWAWQLSMGMGRSLKDYALLPIRVVLNGGEGYAHFDGTVSARWLWLVPIAIAGMWRGVVARRALFAALLYFVLWALSSQQMRFLIPALPLLALATALAIDRLASAVQWPSARRALLTAVGVAAALHLYAASEVVRADARLWWTRFRLSGDHILENAVPPVLQFINANLPLDAKLLFLNFNYGFFCQREFVADSFFEASQINTFLLRNRTADQIRRTLVDRGFTHILVGGGRSIIPYPPTLGQFFDEQTRVLYVSSRHEVVREILGR